MSLKQLDNVPIFWLRLHLNVDSTLRGKTVALSVKQTGASQFFLNGELISKVGHISTIPAEVRGYDPMGEPIALPFSMTPDQFLCVRFAKADLFLIQQFYFENPVLQLKIATIESSLRVYNRSHHINSTGLYLGYFKAGVFLLFAFLHLWLYSYYSAQKSNLYFSIWSFLTAITYSVSAITFHINDLAIRNTISLIFAPLYPVILFIYFHAFLHLFKVKKGTWYTFIVVFFVVSLPMMFRPYQWGWVPGVVGMSGLVTVEICRVTWQAYKKGDKAALIITLGEATYVVLLTLSIVLLNLPSYNAIVTNTLYNIGILAPPFAIIYYLATQFEHNRKSLQQKLVEVQQLSQEKEQTLLGQNAELKAALLQGQTLERQRVAADLHDNLGTTLTALRWTLESMDKSKLTSVEKTVLATIDQQMSQAYTDVRLLSHNLLPNELAKQGLAAALRIMVDKLNRNTPVRFRLSGADTLPRLDRQTEFELYSICLELLNNTVKHAWATQCFINITLTNDALQLTVGDNGTGLQNHQKEGQGLHNVASRVDALRGTWTIETESGVRHQIIVPLRTPAHVLSQT
ncbi:sensor histidine kinase [Spirosoma spitsbergense]|uniref:sensor histidine kinase n=1 Tax=Spirosoma spitsbergense TaxID=431554 RepID=UPI00146EB8CB|nr:histidine kinase [Spirosoma spitsbergense]